MVDILISFWYLEGINLEYSLRDFLKKNVCGICVFILFVNIWIGKVVDRVINNMFVRMFYINWRL